jgi:integrase
MRQGEILNLKWKDLNLKEKYIKVLKTKNNKVRKIPLAQTLEEEFLKLPKLSEYVICNPLTRTKYNNIHKVFDATVKRAKIEHITFHQLRHSAATRMVEKGIDLVVVKEILGHADLSTTQKYSHPVPRRMLDAINELERYSSPISRKEE